MASLHATANTLSYAIAKKFNDCNTFNTRLSAFTYVQIINYYIVIHTSSRYKAE